MSIERQRLAEETVATDSAWYQSGGGTAEAEGAFKAAAFLSGKKTLPLEKVRQALKEHDGDMVDAALFAFGLEVNSVNRQAIVAVMGLKSFKKAEAEAEHVSIEPGNLDADEAAEEVQRAFLTGNVQEVSLNGKHSKGTSVAKDPETGHVYLLKPGS